MLVCFFLSPSYVQGYPIQCIRFISGSRKLGCSGFSRHITASVHCYLY